MSKKTLEERIKESLSLVDREKIYDEVLDESGEIKIAGVTFDHSWAIKKLDRIAYDCGLNDYFDSSSDIYYELDGEYYWASEVNELIRCMEDEE